MKKNWSKFYSSPQQHQIVLLQQLLEDEGIKSFTINKKDSSYLFGEIELYVDAEDVLKAIQIKDKHPEF